ncbi:MAG: ABC transporter ATP-binding protein, partial [Acidimicrobiia bacterium]
LTLVALSAVPLFLLTMLRLTRRISTVARKQRRIEGELASTASESLGAIKVVQSYSLEGRFESTFADHNRRSLKDGVKAKRLTAGLERKTDVLVAIATGLVLLFGAQMVLGGTLTPGDLVVFITYLKNAFKPMRDTAKYTGRLATAAASGERIVDILDTEPDIRDRPDAREAPPLRGEVRFEGVSLAYGEGREVLRELDLVARPGERVALVGSSGAGKSSLAGLLLRLYDPDQGRITVDGTDIRELTLASLRGQIAIVLQESVLFATSIGENIALGAPGAGRREVEAAARLAGAHQFITALPDGYQSVVGERGDTLSGGERQRIAVARAAIRKAPIVILDEPTAGLDRRNQAAVLEALRRLSHGRTVFHIAHDLATVRDADQILYLDDGRVVEAGSHDQLIWRNGRYAAMYRFQEQNRAAEEGAPGAGGGDARTR